MGLGIGSLGYRKDLAQLEMWDAAFLVPYLAFPLIGVGCSSYRWEQELFQWVPGLDGVWGFCVALTVAGAVRAGTGKGIFSRGTGEQDSFGGGATRRS